MIGSSRRECMQLSDWPTRDREAWEAAMGSYDPLDVTTGRAAGWSPSTRRVTMHGYGSWLSFLERIGQLDREAAPGARVTRERAKAYWEMLKAAGYAPYTIAGRLQQLYDGVRMIEPETDWSWLSAAYWKVRKTATRVSDVDARMRPAEEVLALGMDLMHRAEVDPYRTDFDRAVLYRDGLALALLVFRPLRAGNLSSIRIGRHLVQIEGKWHVFFEGSEMKNGRPFSFEWPSSIVPYLEQYLAVHRGTLLESAEDLDFALWVSKGGGSMTRTVLAHRIEKRTADALGTAINVHTFRHMAATRVATEDPENITAVPALLSHSSLHTSEVYYNRARAVNASASYQSAVVRPRRRNKARPLQPELDLFSVPSSARLEF